MDKIAVLIPCFNEAQTIFRVVSDFRDVFPESVVYVYDNNSSDGTPEAAACVGAVVRYEGMQGKGNVVRRMFKDIKAEVYIIVDGDDTYPACHAAEMAKMVLDGGVDMVIGDRLSTTYFSENKRPFHGLGNILVRSCINILFGSDIRDALSGYRAFSRQFVELFPARSTGFEVEAEMTVFAIENGFKIANIPIEYRDRQAGSTSKLHTFRDGCRILRTVLYMYAKRIQSRHNA